LGKLAENHDGSNGVRRRVYHVESGAKKEKREPRDRLPLVEFSGRGPRVEIKAGVLGKEKKGTGGTGSRENAVVTLERGGKKFPVSTEKMKEKTKAVNRRFGDQRIRKPKDKPGGS